MEQFKLSQNYIDHFNKLGVDIKNRILEFKKVTKEEYFYELCYCILTPQTKAVNAELAIYKLKNNGFKYKEIDVNSILRDPENYIRFHNVKTNRLLIIKEKWNIIDEIISSNKINEFDKRAWLIDNVLGMSWKESSHFLRNIGFHKLSIIDRHILKHLLNCGVINELPKNLSKKKYLEIEEKFRNLANNVGLSMQELDLLFWSYEEGSVRK